MNEDNATVEHIETVKAKLEATFPKDQFGNLDDAAKHLDGEISSLTTEQVKLQVVINLHLIQRALLLSRKYKDDAPKHREKVAWQSNKPLGFNLGARQVRKAVKLGDALQACWEQGLSIPLTDLENKYEALPRLIKARLHGKEVQHQPKPSRLKPTPLGRLEKAVQSFLRASKSPDKSSDIHAVLKAVGVPSAPQGPELMPNPQEVAPGCAWRHIQALRAMTRPELTNLLSEVKTTAKRVWITACWQRSDFTTTDLQPLVFGDPQKETSNPARTIRDALESGGYRLGNKEENNRLTYEPLTEQTHRQHLTAHQRRQESDAEFRETSTARLEEVSSND